MIQRLQAVPDGARQSNGVMVRALPIYTMQACMRALRKLAPWRRMLRAGLPQTAPRETSLFRAQVDNDGTAVSMARGDDGSSSDEGSSGDDEACAQQPGAAPHAPLRTVEEGGEQGAGEAGDDAMDVDNAPPQSGPVIDKDGFQLVQRGRRLR